MTVGMMILAQAAPAAGGAGAGAFGMLPMIGIVLAIMYFMTIRPQQRQAKERKKMLAEIKTGDRILFSGGILGAVTNVKDQTLVVKVADNVKLEIARGAVSRVIDKDDKISVDEPA